LVDDDHFVDVFETVDTAVFAGFVGFDAELLVDGAGECG